MAPAKPVPLTVIDTNKTPWEPFPVPYIKTNLDHNPLHFDEESGMTILKLQYRAGFTNPWHSHFCGHGFYVLDGILDTHAGQYGPGSWVWFPEGGTMVCTRFLKDFCVFGSQRLLGREGLSFSLAMWTALLISADN